MSIETSPASGSLEIPGTMLAWQAAAAGEPAGVLALAEVPVPVPGAGQVLVEVWSAGLGRGDVESTRAAAGHPLTPGHELVGEIVAVGPGGDRIRLGERVVGVTLAPHGSLAKYALARGQDVLPAPVELADAAASVFAVAYQAGWFGLYRRAALHVGDSLLVHGAAGALGGAACQLGRAAGAKVIGVVSSEARVTVARRMGAEIVVRRDEIDVADAVREITNGRGVDVVYDVAGGKAYTTAASVTAVEGRIVLAGTASGDVPEIAAGDVRLRGQAVLGLDLALYRERPDLMNRAHADLSSLVGAGALVPNVAEKIPFEEAPEALGRIAAGAVAGRIAVSPP